MRSRANGRPPRVCLTSAAAKEKALRSAEIQTTAQGGTQPGRLHGPPHRQSCQPKLANGESTGVAVQGPYEGQQRSFTRAGWWRRRGWIGHPARALHSTASREVSVGAHTGNRPGAAHPRTRRACSPLLSDVPAACGAARCASQPMAMARGTGRGSCGASSGHACRQRCWGQACGPLGTAGVRKPWHQQLACSCKRMTLQGPTVWQRLRSPAEALPDKVPGWPAPRCGRPAGASAQSRQRASAWLDGTESRWPGWCRKWAAPPTGPRASSAQR